MINENNPSSEEPRKSMVEWLNEEVRNNPSDTFSQLLLAFFRELDPGQESGS